MSSRGASQSGTAEKRDRSRNDASLLGEIDGALDDLERAITARRGWLLPFLDVAPSFDALRDAPRFQRAIAQIHAGAPLR